MIRQQCAAKGFDAVEPDIGDSYTDNNGFGITEAQNVALRQDPRHLRAQPRPRLGAEERRQDPAFSPGAGALADFLLTEECNYYHTCRDVTAPYVGPRSWC